MNTRRLLDFGPKQLRLAGKLLSAIGTIHDRTLRLKTSVTPEWNPSSGYVYLVDESFNVAMFDGDFLSDWYVCPVCSNEGFLGSFREHGKPCCHQVATPSGN